MTDGTRTNMLPPPENHGDARNNWDYFCGAGPLNLRVINEDREEDKDKDCNRKNALFGNNDV